MQDLRDDATGVFAAYADVLYSADGANVQGPIIYGINYENGTSGDTSIDGLIDEVGAFDGLDRLGPDEQLLFSVLMRATQEGPRSSSKRNRPTTCRKTTCCCTTSRIRSRTEQIEYRGVEIFVEPGIGNPLRTNPSNSLDVNNDATVSPIDALLVINELNADLNPLAARTATPTTYYLDTSSDGQLTPLDALLVINKLNADMAEGENANDGVAAIAAAIHADSSSDAAMSDTEVSKSTPTLMADASSTTLTLGQRSSIFDSIDDLALAEDDVDDDMDSVLDLICDDLSKRNV